MMTRDEHARLSANWEGPIYETYGSMETRFQLVEPYLPMFTLRSVLEIGCNAAIMMQPIMLYADAYIGLEPHHIYYQQALETRFALGDERTWIHNMDLGEYLRGQGTDALIFDALYLSNILYWLSDAELTLLREVVLPRCSDVIILTRAKERRTQKNSALLNRRENVWALLEEAGFHVQDDVHIGKRGKPDYYITVGVRR